MNNKFWCVISVRARTIFNETSYSLGKHAEKYSLQYIAGFRQAWPSQGYEIIFHFIKYFIYFYRVMYLSFSSISVFFLPNTNTFLV